MTPPARAAAAIELLDAWLAGGERMERLLRDWGKANRYAGSKDRRAIADIVYDGIRRMRSLSWQSGATGGRAIVHGLALADGWPVEEIFSEARFAPTPLAEAEQSPGRSAPPDPVAFDHPDWLEMPLRAALGADYHAAMAAMTLRAPVDLRINRLKASRDEALARLLADGIDAAPVGGAPDALRCPAGTRLAASPAYQEGWVELQDVASQRAAAFALPPEWGSILDYCAGGGGKALAFASLTGGAARIVAHDIARDRMKDLPERAARAGAHIEIAPNAEAIDGKFDLVFVDAPCSGSGVWRRDPEAKWHLTPERLEALRALQEDAFAAALRFVRPGGRIAYATCSILRAENEERCAALCAAHDLEEVGASLRLMPGESDGFFCALFTVWK